MKLRTRILQVLFFFLAFSTFSPLIARAAPRVETVRISPGAAPIAENLTLETYTGVSASGTLTALDSDDTRLTYRVITGPRKGTVTLREDGAFLYTPGENRRGRDTFSFTASDPMGNISNVAQVTVRIRKPASPVSYSDTRGTEADYAARYLAEEGLFIGARVGGTWRFFPEETMTEGEFLAMCAALTDRPLPETASLPAQTPLTDRKAAALLDHFLHLTDVRCDDSALQALANVEACRLMTCAPEATALTRGEAARILAAAGHFLEHRE